MPMAHEARSFGNHKNEKKRVKLLSLRKEKIQNISFGSLNYFTAHDAKIAELIMVLSGGPAPLEKPMIVI